MKRLRILVLTLACALFVGNLSFLSVEAGKTVELSAPFSAESELNNTDWYFADSNIVSKDGTLVIPADVSTSDTRFVAKTISKVDKSVNEMTGVDTKLCFTALPSGQKFILAFGVASIDANAGGTNSVEMIFTNEGGIKMSIVAYTEAGAEEIMAAQSCGVSMNKDFTVHTVITSEAKMTVEINGKNICDTTLPIEGTGRFGVFQTGNCGAVISEMNYFCSHYETPENSNIFEDFENGDFNVKEFYSTSKTNGCYPSYIGIEEMDGNKVLRFKNTGLAYFATQKQYSNFEISFDIPYFLREDVYDEDGTQLGKRGGNIGVSFGSHQYEAEGYAYVHDVDLITIREDSVVSHLRHIWEAPSLVELGIVDMDSNEGFSFKYSVVDGHAVCQVKKLSSDKWVTVGEGDYDLQKTGYIYIWSTGNADVALDNIKITNLDENAKVIELEHESNIVTAEDYELTAEEKTLTFRPVEEEKAGFTAEMFVVCCAAGAVAFAVIGIVIGSLLKRKKTVKEVKTDEKI